MMNRLFILAFLYCFSSYAQYSIKGTIDPNHDYSWILLYKMENGNQTYVDNADVVDGEFEFNIDEKEPSGIYRAYYQIENSLYVEFIFNKEEIIFSFNPDEPEESLAFSLSEENDIYQSYYKSISSIQKKIDSLQVSFFKSSDPKEDQEIIESYKHYFSEINKEQKRFEDNSVGKIANHFIRASAQQNSEIPIKEPEVYMNRVKKHFFDAIDLKDTVLSNSSFIKDRLNDYIFYLNQADNQEAMNTLHQKAITNAIDWIGDDLKALQNFEELLIEEYLLEENVTMVYFVIDNYYNLLPVEYQNNELKNKVIATLKTAIGITAPDFTWDDNGTSNNLHSLTGTDYYIVVFFSSSCPHCQVETPKFHDFIIGIENIKVVAVGLEDQKESWELMIQDYHEFINILDLDKWSSQKVKDYGISAIPGYFVLDAEKRVLAKPKDFEELKSMFEER